MFDFSTKNALLIQKTFGVGSNRAFDIFKKILDSGLIKEDISKIILNLNFSPEIRAKLLSVDYSVVDKIIENCNKRNIKIIIFGNKEYPTVLSNIDTPPLALFVKGNLPDFNILPSITIVGPRKPTEFGLKASYSLGYRLAKAGMIVVSGGALGCDSRAHIGALKSGGITVAVLGCGIDAEYLAENKPLWDKISQTGCLISEYPPLTKPTRFSFPVRNRILSGLTLGTVVVEAKEKSGTLSTAKNALEQGRDVFVIPGNPVISEYKGSNALLRDGAKPLIDTSDIFGEYIIKYPEYIDIKKAFSEPAKTENPKNNKKIKKNIKETLSNEAKIVYNYLDNDVFTVDDLVGTELSSDDIFSAITELELEEMISPQPGGTYKKI